jgi:hypothetical protein
VGGEGAVAVPRKVQRIEQAQYARWSLAQCPTGKQGYATRSAAKSTMKRKLADGFAVDHVYRCREDGCDQFHLTSTPPSPYWKNRQAWSE